MERQKTGEILRALSVRSQTLGQKKKRTCSTHCSLVIKINEDERKEREKKEGNKKMEKEGGEGKKRKREKN